MEDKMKKTTSLMLALLFSGAMLLGEAINTTTKAAEDAVVEPAGLKCNLLTGCTGGAGCEGQGEGADCIIVCADDTVIFCPRAKEAVAEAVAGRN